MYINTIEGYKLAPQQRRLWQIQDGRTPFRAIGAVEICGDISECAVMSAVEQVITKNDILRTSFHRRAGMKMPIQVVDLESRPRWKETDLRGMSVLGKAASARQLRGAAREEDENVDSRCGVNVELVRLTDRESVLVVNLASLCADSWAVSSLTRQICELASGAQSVMPEEEDDFQYFQFAQWQNELLESDEPEERRA